MEEDEEKERERKADESALEGKKNSVDGAGAPSNQVEVIFKKKAMTRYLQNLIESDKSSYDVLKALLGDLVKWEVDLHHCSQMR